MEYPVQLFEIARDAPAADRPRSLAGFVVSAETSDAARCAVRERLAAEGRSIRSLSVLAAGGLAAVVYPQDASGARGGA